MALDTRYANSKRKEANIPLYCASCESQQETKTARNPEKTPIQ